MPRRATDDPIDAWKLDEADEAYARAISLKRDEASRASAICLYATFLEQKRRDPKRACDLQRKAACEKTSACAAPAAR